MHDSSDVPTGLGRYLGLTDCHAKWLEELRAKTTRSRSIPLAKEDFKELISLAAGIAGTTDLVKIQGVVLPTNQLVPTHPHEGQHVVIYMPQDHPSRLMFQNPDVAFNTDSGHAVLIPAGQWHSVEYNKGMPRYTIAMLFRATSVRGHGLFSSDFSI